MVKSRVYTIPMKFNDYVIIMSGFIKLKKVSRTEINFINFHFE